MFIFGGYEQLVSSLCNCYLVIRWERGFPTQDIGRSRIQGHICIHSCFHFITRQSYGINYPGYAHCFAEKMVGKVGLKKMVDFFFFPKTYRYMEVKI